MVKIENADIIYVTFKNDMFHNPFFVAVDHPTKSIVVAIRGTLSIDDLIVDGNGRPFPVDIPGLPESFKAHHGIIRCARVLKEKLESLKLLPKAFASYPDYNLVLTGQSLGAGTATVLGMMLRADYPNLKCYAYAPPGGLLSADAAKYCESFVISLIYGDDLVGRMGIYSFEMLKYQIMGELNKCRTPKYRILLGDLYWLCGGFPKMRYDEKSGVIKHENGIASKESKSTVISVEDDGGKAKDVDDTVTKRTASKYSQYTVPEIKKLQPFEDMYPPGNILHITETETFKSAKKSGSRGAPRWSIRFADKSEFREFKVTSRMLFDHLPFRMYKALQDFSRRMINDCDISRHPPLVIDNIFKKKCKS
jgi:sn1-specific diacylglycerol lipase